MAKGPSQSEQNQQTQSWAHLNQLFKTATDTASSFGGKGSSTLDDVTKYLRSLLSGNRSETAQAVAPAANAARASADAAKKERADTGTGRTGGTIAENQQSEDKVRSEIDNLIGGVKPAAASALTGIGEADISAMMSALGLGMTAAGTVGGQTSYDINAQRQAAADMWGSLIGGIGDLAGATLPFVFTPHKPA